MFGYVIPDKPNMFMKDYTLYRAFYCGICKSIGKHHSQLMRFTTNYDITFLNVLYHSVMNVDIEISNEACILNPLKKKSIVKDDEYTNDIIKINTLLAHYKCIDDILDNNSTTKKLVDKIILKKHVKQAKEKFPNVDKILDKYYQQLRELEKNNCGDIEMISHPFAQIMKEITEELFKEKYTSYLGEMMYNVGKWVYIMDAIDDAEDDYKEKKFNPFLVDYTFTTRKAFLEDNKLKLEKILMNCYNNIVDNFDNIKITKYEGVITNILWYGLLANTKEMLRREEKCKKIHI